MTLVTGGVRKTNLFVFGDDVGEERRVDLSVVSALLQADAVYLARFDFRRRVSGIHLFAGSATSEGEDMDQRHLEDTVFARLFLHQQVECFRFVSRGNHTIGNLSGDDLGSSDVARSRESNEIAKRGHPIRTYVTFSQICNNLLFRLKD